jgi:hypothetical protein
MLPGPESDVGIRYGKLFMDDRHTEVSESKGNFQAPYLSIRSWAMWWKQYSTAYEWTYK